MWSVALSVALARGVAAAAEEADGVGGVSLPPDARGPADMAATSMPAGGKQPLKPAAAEPAVGKEPPKPAAAEPKKASTKGMAQFAIPKAAVPGRPPPTGAKTPPPELQQRLTYQYAYGSQSDVVYRRNSDLNRGVKDDSLVLAPQLNAYVTYRPTDWLESTLEMKLDKEFPVVEQDKILLPNGETQLAVPRSWSLLIEQIYLALKGPADRARLVVGRRNFEDERHFLLDTSLDTVGFGIRFGQFRAEAAMGREIFVDLNLLKGNEAGAHQQGAQRRKDLINTYLFAMDYRGIADVKLGAFVVYRDDKAKLEGRPLQVGFQSQGTPNPSFSYWALFALQGGWDELSRNLRGYGLDVGITYRFTGLALYPSLTLGYAYGSGDANPTDGRNTEFRQTGLQSNEARFSGLARFKVYGEVLDPELSNLRIVTVAVGFRPLNNLSVELVYHRYQLAEFAGELRSTALTALMNQVEGQPSKDVGSAFDVVFGIRGPFGIRRLGVDVRVGLFFPGKAFLTDRGSPEKPNIRSADRGFTAFTKFWW